MPLKSAPRALPYLFATAATAAAVGGRWLLDPWLGQDLSLITLFPAVAACVWDFAGEMEMLRNFWDAAQALDPDAPDEGRVMRFGKPGEIVELFEAAGLVDLVESGLGVSALYTGFEDLWTGFMEGIGPAGSYAVALPDDHRQRLRAEVERRLDVGNGPFELAAVARCAVGRVLR